MPWSESAAALCCIFHTVTPYPPSPSPSRLSDCTFSLLSGIPSSCTWLTLKCVCVCITCQQVGTTCSTVPACKLCRIKSYCAHCTLCTDLFNKLQSTEMYSEQNMMLDFLYVVLKFHAKSPFTLDKNPQLPLTSGFCLHWDRVQLAFILGSNESAVVTGIYRLHSQSAVIETQHPSWTH